MAVHQGLHPVEKVLIIALRPSFIGSEFLEEENTLNIVICCRAFKYLPVEERIKMVYDIINNTEELEEKPTVIVQAYNEEELDALLETIL
jgi:hypothetical protein